MIGKTLIQILKEKNMSISELGLKAGVSRQTLYSITKRDSTKISLSALLRICDVLDVSIDRFYNDCLSSENTHQELQKKSQEKLHENTLIKIFEKLSEKGKDKVIDYANMVYASEQNKNLTVQSKQTTSFEANKTTTPYRLIAFGGDNVDDQPPIPEQTL